MEGTLQTLKQLVLEGKIQYIGLSECSARYIRMADEIFSKISPNPFAFVQSACSVSTQRVFRNGVFDLCREKGIQFVSYTSVVRGLVDSRISECFSEQSLDNMEPQAILEKVIEVLGIPAGDFKLHVGFFAPEVIKENLRCILKFQNLAKSWNMSPSELSLAWQVSQDIVPIPGTTSENHLKDNVSAGSKHLTKDQIATVNACFESFKGNPNIDGALDDADLEVK